MFLYSVLCAYKYETFTVTTNFQVPFANNSQWYIAVQDGENQFHEFLNHSMLPVDPTLRLGVSGKQYYTRVEKDHEACIVSEGAPKEAFLPNLEAFEDMGTARIDGQLMRHFRLVDKYSSDAHDNATYLGESYYQQEFYCQELGAQCVPKRWEIYGRSNFDSHTDYYVLEFFNYTATVDEKYFEVSELCKEAKASSPRHSPLSMLYESQVAQKNIRLINKINANKKFTFKAAPNAFLRHTHSRLLSERAGRAAGPVKIHDPDLPECKALMKGVPQHLDWRIKGAVGPVKDQIFCGSCWTFATMGMLEGRVNIMRNKLGDITGKRPPLIKFSEQAIVDCFWDAHEADPFLASQGCSGGQPDYAIQWLQNEMGSKLPLEENYPYLGQDDWCHPEHFTYDEFVIDRVCKVPQGTQDLKLALQSGPVAVTIDVPESMAFYAGGIYNDPACVSEFSQLDHNVVLVGYGVDDEAGNYWIIRNSWSNLWGSDGYIYIAEENNLCGVQTDAMYVTLQKRE